MRVEGRMTWTRDFHSSFVEAVRSLGGAHSATPKLILQRMRNNSGVTTRQIKSHLQTYRNKGRQRNRSRGDLKGKAIVENDENQKEELGKKTQHEHVILDTSSYPYVRKVNTTSAGNNAVSGGRFSGYQPPRMMFLGESSSRTVATLRVPGKDGQIPHYTCIVVKDLLLKSRASTQAEGKEEQRMAKRKYYPTTDEYMEKVTKDVWQANWGPFLTQSADSLISSSQSSSSSAAAAVAPPNRHEEDVSLELTL